MDSADNEATTLRCVIIGAGIAGLSAAIGLCKAGHKVDVYEKSTFKNEIGAAVTLTPNASLVLDRWGYDHVRTGGTPKLQYRLLHPKTKELVEHVHLADVSKICGHAYNAYHRVDMHEELRKLATNAGATLHLGWQATALDCASGTVQFEGKPDVTADLVVVADGIKSRFVKAVAGQCIPSKSIGKSVYRTLIPVDRLIADPVTRPLWENQPSGFLMSEDEADGTLFVTYPCRDDKLMNFAFFHSTKEHQRDAQSWQSPATVQDVVDVLGNYDPVFSSIAKHADSMACYVVGVRDVLPRMANDRVAIIGDAAHPMPPTHAQGGGMGIEDAAALQVLFSNWTNQDNVPLRLRLFNNIRHPRCLVTQLTSFKVSMSHEDDEKTKMIRKRCGQSWDGPLLPLGATPWSEPVQQFYYGYDAFAAAEKAMLYKDDPDGMPKGFIEHFGGKS